MRSVSRTFDVLDALAAAPDGLGVTEISSHLNESPSTIHRLLAALVERGIAARDSSRRYHLGTGTLRYAQSLQRHDRLIRIGQPYLARLSERTRESVFLSRIVGDDVVCVASAESPRPITFYMRPGERTPYHAASSARAILAYMGDDVARALLTREDLQSFTDRTPVTVNDALDELVRTRQRGYAICDDEMEVGVTGLAAPVRDSTGDVCASVTIVGPRDRLAADARDQLVGSLLETTSELSMALGFRPVLTSRETHLGAAPIAV